MSARALSLKYLTQLHSTTNLDTYITQRPGHYDGLGGGIVCWVSIRIILGSIPNGAGTMVLWFC